MPGDLCVPRGREMMMAMVTTYGWGRRGARAVAGGVSAVLGVCLLAGCSDGPPELPSAPSAQPTSTGPVFTPPEEACKGGKPFESESPPYAGTGPHKLIGFQARDHDQATRYFPPDEPALPAEWAGSPGVSPATGVFIPLETSAAYLHAQLALCMSDPHITGRPVGVCSYTGEDTPNVPGSPIEVISAYYDFVVYELKTGRRVTSFRIDGHGADHCPKQISGGIQHVAQGFDDATLVDQLRGLVEGPAR